MSLEQPLAKKEGMTSMGALIIIVSKLEHEINREELMFLTVSGIKISLICFAELKAW